MRLIQRGLRLSLRICLALRIELVEHCSAGGGADAAVDEERFKALLLGFRGGQGAWHGG